MTTPITETHRTVLRALADTVVPSLDRPDDPTGFWALSGSDLGAHAGVEAALSALPDQDRAGLLTLLDGLAAHGFAAAPRDMREEVMGGVARLGPEAAAAMSALVSLTVAFAYAGSDVGVPINPMWAAFGYPGAPPIEPGGDGAPQPFVPTGPVLNADVCVVGLQRRGVEATPFVDAMALMDWGHGRPKEQAWMAWRGLAETLAKPGPGM